MDEASSNAAAVTEANETELSLVIQFDDLAYAAAASQKDAIRVHALMPEEHFRLARILL